MRRKAAVRINDRMTVKPAGAAIEAPATDLTDSVVDWQLTGTADGGVHLVLVLEPDAEVDMEVDRVSVAELGRDPLEGVTVDGINQAWLSAGMAASGAEAVMQHLRQVTGARP